MPPTNSKAFRIQSGLSLNESAYIFEGTVDPTTAFTNYGNPPAGSVYIQNIATPVIYLKTGALVSNWRIISVGDWQTLLNRPDGQTLIPGFTDTYLMFPDIADPVAPTGDNILLYAKKIAGRSFPKWVDPTGLDNIVQPSIAANKVSWWNPPGNATTVPGVLGMAAMTALGTATARTIATTNMFTRMRRLGYVSSNTANNLCGHYSNQATITMGAGGNLGGFFKVVRFGCSAVTSSFRMFVGISSMTGAPTSVEPSTLTNSIGIGRGAADTNLKIYYGGSAAQAPIDLGVNFPANTSNVDIYELILFNPANDSLNVNYRVSRLNTGDVVEGVLTAATSGIQLPLPTTLLSTSRTWRTNNTGSNGAAGLDIMSDYIETDY
jgi:hypothetical protein